MFIEETSKNNTIMEVQKTKLFFTGSCIVAYASEDTRTNSDFLCSYIDYAEAYELYFEEGMLKEKQSLISAIEKAARNTNGYTYRIEAYQRAQLREHIAREPLKYKYDQRTYKWRYK